MTSFFMTIALVFYGVFFLVFMAGRQATKNPGGAMKAAWFLKQFLKK